MDTTITNEITRLRALAALAILDTGAEARFDRFTRLASAAFTVPISLVSLVDSERQWFKSRTGLEVEQTPRSMAFCSHVVDSREMMVVPDATQDARFVDNPLVTGDPNIRFYAGQPIFAPGGEAVGTLCIIDRNVRQLSAGERDMLRELAGLVQDEMNRAVLVRQRDAAERSLLQLNADLEQRIEERTRSIGEANEALRREIRQREVVESTLRRSEWTLEQKQELLDAVLESVDVGVVACSADGELTLFNRAARDFHGMPPEAISSADWAAHYSLFQADGKSALQQQDIPLFRALQGEIVKDAAMVIAPRALPARHVLASGRPLIGPGGRVLGAVVAMNDVTELSASRLAVACNEQRLRTITEQLPAMIGQVDREGRFTFLNSHAARFYGKDVQELIGQHVRSAHTSAQYAEVEGHIESALAGQRVSFEGAFDGGGGRQLHFHATYIPDFDAHGETNGFLAMSSDITARKAGELRQRDSEERLRTIANNLPVLISYIDGDRRYQFANSVHEEWLGIHPSAMLGKTVEEVYGQRFCEPRRHYLDQCLQGKETQMESVMRNRDGQERTALTTFVPHVRGEQVVGAYLLTTDVTATRQHEEHLRSLAHTDTLTGLSNRRSFNKQFELAIHRSMRMHSGLALMILDIDHFKSINDTLGHAAGDVVLREFAARLGAAVRRSDVVFRLAGDEFTIILEGIDSPAECATVARKVIEAMRVPFQVEGQARHVSTSIGVTWHAGQESTVQLLSEQADAALYRAKAAGRNRFEIS